MMTYVFNIKILKNRFSFARPVFTLEGNDYDDESRSDESTKIFNEVPRETPRHHILLLNHLNFGRGTS